MEFLWECLRESFCIVVLPAAVDCFIATTAKEKGRQAKICHKEGKQRSAIHGLRQMLVTHYRLNREEACRKGQTRSNASAGHGHGNPAGRSQERNTDRTSRQIQAGIGQSDPTHRGGHVHCEPHLH